MEDFSVLISVYYRESPEFLKRALNSVFEQSVPPSEVILVKDGALTVDLNKVVDEFLESYPTFKVVVLSENVGLGNALNAGLAKCSNELIARMDSDDISVPDRFRLQLEAFRRFPEVSVVGGWISEFENDPNKVIAYRKVPEYNFELKQLLHSKSPMNHVTTMFRKSEVLKVGGYQHFYLLEDYWLWIRMVKNGAQLYNVQQVLVNVRGGMKMAARRGGVKYACSEARLFNNMRKMKLINPVVYVRNISVRMIVRLLPNFLRSYIYLKFLRTYK